ncbi:unnamed protein product [Vitrella brassicaformis CCMP3155]|uniref:Uncharacterized protein n=2 Tax=Vitrella brassicaformis TaxID=1169539 RepID=A0A0G4H0F2_VITBC|nr:unnamed protein product [Vitrella brassicaformis CCMP3155]|eukprot:CEM36888.1 unnamed protein product [Vitrella brassicaformis CCMP3155]
MMKVVLALALAVSATAQQVDTLEDLLSAAEAFQALSALPTLSQRPVSPYRRASSPQMLGNFLQNLTPKQTSQSPPAGGQAAAASPVKRAPASPAVRKAVSSAPPGSGGKYSQKYEMQRKGMYVPRGLTADQYQQALRADEEKRAGQKKFWEGRRGKFETLADWQKEKEEKFPNQPKAGYSFVKLTYGKK